MRSSPVTILASLSVIGLLAGCGASTHPAATQSSGGIGGSVSTALGTEPKIVVPTGAPPSRLETSDIVVGHGTLVTSTSETVTIQYEGVNFAGGKVFDASWTDTPGQPTTFALTQVVPGFGQGIVGMRIGGRREIVIPPALGYGAAGSPPAVGPNETLIFVVDLVAVSSGTGPG
ncbi:MAG TPA: FKBP-type peptidyl-prolyl cis-trans isomerase [Mycobacteriales bacterium]|nr:FKBP-type peptidyl-prolyl cis-trans isomerase [Mycobacteriales bacterium]